MAYIIALTNSKFTDNYTRYILNKMPERGRCSRETSLIIQRLGSCTPEASLHTDSQGSGTMYLTEVCTFTATVPLNIQQK